MKRLLATVLIGVSALVFPMSLFAQTDGSAEPVTPPREEMPKEVPVETAPPLEEAPVTEPAAPLSEPAPAPTPVPEPTLAQAPAPTPRPAAAQPAPAQPLAAPTTVEAATSTPAPEPPPLEEIQEMFEAVAEVTSSPLRSWLYAIAGALSAAGVLLGIQAWLKKAGQKGTKKCEHCAGSGREHASETCVGCEGTGTIEEEHEASVECPHCGGEGEEPCEPCKGEGEYDGKPCATCDAKGVKQDEDGENVECEACGGEGEASVTLKRDATCPDCKGGMK